MIRVGVVRGGISHKYDQSLETGASVLRVLREHFPGTYTAVDILITKDGVWHIAGRPVDSDKLRDSVDVIWNALHGAYGEDGGLQDILEELGIPYTGSGPVASAVGATRSVVRDRAREIELHTSDEYLIPDYRSQIELLPEVYLKEHAQNIFLKFSPPWLVHPQHGEPVIARTRGELLDVLRDVSSTPGDIAVAEYIHGKQSSVLIADQFRGEEVYAFLPQGDKMATHQKNAVTNFAKSLYQKLGLRHFAQVHFTVTPKRTYLATVTTNPHITHGGVVHEALSAVGAHLPDFIDHVITLALGKRPR